jgi:hypothetical protein
MRDDDDVMRAHRERHADAMRRVRVMGERARDVLADYERMNEDIATVLRALRS